MNKTKPTSSAFALKRHGRVGLMLQVATLLQCATAMSLAETWHVRAGADAGDGRTSASAFTTIQQAADIVKPGDTVVVGVGVYYESVQLRTKGTADQPITFKTDQVARDRVIVTGAHQAIRKKEIHWTLEDKELGLYSVPWDQPMPARCLYSGADLYPYSDLAHLRQFISMNVEQMRKLAGAVAVPPSLIEGPQHGYAIDGNNKRLYVRLHSSGKYGNPDPNQQLMCISPPQVAEVLKSNCEPPEFNFGIIGPGDGHIIVDGFTFETPSIVAVYTEANDVVVRNCWFIGCHSGVGGTATYGRPKDYKYDKFANRITVEQCEYTQYPAYDDGCEAISRAFAAVGNPARVVPSFWQRKDTAGGLPGGSFTYEIGIARLMGRDWVIRRNHVHDAFEALSARATTNSDNLHVYENVFDKLLDNVIETEDHAANLHFYRNVISDTFSPISWQPLKGAPYPGPIYIYQNIIFTRPAHLESFEFRHAAVFKFLAKTKLLPITVPDPGFVVFNNTVFWPGDTSTLIAANRSGQFGFKFYNNVFISPFGYFPYVPKGKWEGDEYVKVRNFIGGTEPGKPGATACAGEGGRTFASFTEIGLEDPAAGKHAPRPDSPLIGAAVPVPGAPLQLIDIGALQQGDQWFPLRAGPLANLTPADASAK